MDILKQAFGKRSRKKATQAPLATALTIDYPKEGERVTSHQYTFRISAGPALNTIEISINGDSWQHARPTNGFWWYDWQGYGDGPKIVLMRGVTETGEKVTSRRQFTVKFE